MSIKNYLIYLEKNLKEQAIGSYESIKSGHPDYYMKLPFWSWLDNKEK